MKNKKGKKLVVLGAMAALLTLIGVSGSQTYAKYVDSKEMSTQTATVAKWGFVLDLNANNLFSTDHVTASNGTSVTSDDNGVTVNAASSTLVIAPGTEGYVTFGITGSAEVKSIVKFTVAGDDVGISDGVKTYEPLKWTLMKSTAPGVGGSYNPSAYDEEVLKDATLAEIIEELTISQTLSAKENIYANYKLSYVWKFANPDQTGLDDLDTDGVQNLTGNQCDTLMGKYANDVDSINNNYTVDNDLTLSIKVDVEQLNA